MGFNRRIHPTTGTIVTFVNLLVPGTPARPKWLADLDTMAPPHSKPGNGRRTVALLDRTPGSCSVQT